MAKKNKKGHIDIGCEFCGKEISKCTDEFGMDCEDDCARKLYEEKFGKITHNVSDKKEEMDRIFEDIEKIAPGGGDFLKGLISGWDK